MTVPPAESAVHVAKFRLDQMEDGVALPQGPLLPVPLLHRELAAGMLARASYDGSRPVIAVHPGSGGKAKQWPLDSYLQLLEELRAGLGPFLVIFSGPAEDDAAKDRLDAFARGRTGAVHIADADLPAVAALLRSADLYIGNDSGVSHLAAAAGCRVIALFGPTDPARWRPVGEAVEVIRSPELADLPVSKVFDRVRDILAAAGAEPPGRKKDNGGSEES
jgi:ADP-heptose:LPS heptosyltransferase